MFFHVSYALVIDSYISPLPLSLSYNRYAKLVGGELEKTPDLLVEFVAGSIKFGYIGVEGQGKPIDLDCLSNYTVVTLHYGGYAIQANTKNDHS